MNRPYVICHMTVSLDGKVTGEHLVRSNHSPASEVYYEINRDLAPDAFACGRVTMEGSFTGGYYPDLSAFEGCDEPYLDHVADAGAGFFAVAFDRQGRLGWQTPRIVDEDPGYGGAHIIEVLTEQAPAAYLSYLKSIGVSYIFGGEVDLDLSYVLKKLHRLFGIETLLLEGGSVINGAFQRADMIDEISLVIAPTVADAADLPLFANSTLSDFALAKTKVYDGGVLWLNYRRKEI